MKTTTIRTSHIIVIAFAALALLFGTAATGAVAGAKWIDGKRIEKNSIPADRLKKATITSKQLKKGAVTKRQLAKGSVSGDSIAKGSIGTQSLTDDAVDELQQTVVYVDNIISSEQADSSGYVAVTCPADTQVVAGYTKPGGTGLAAFQNSYIDPTRNALMVQFSIDGTVTVQTICLR